MVIGGSLEDGGTDRIMIPGSLRKLINLATPDTGRGAIIVDL